MVDMKKIIVFLFIISLLFIIGNHNRIFINNGIRYRIVANGDDKSSQELKWQINSEVIPIIETFDHSSKEKMQQSIKDNLEKIDSVVKKYTDNYKIVYGDNYFPEKEYNNVTYKDGYYDSLVIYLGSSTGHNWWCFMFPPLCELEIQKDNLSDIEYDFYFKSIIKKYL